MTLLPNPGCNHKCWSVLRKLCIFHGLQFLVVVWIVSHIFSLHVPDSSAQHGAGLHFSDVSVLRCCESHNKCEAPVRWNRSILPGNFHSGKMEWRWILLALRCYSKSLGGNFLPSGLRYSRKTGGTGEWAYLRKCRKPEYPYLVRTPRRYVPLLQDWYR